MAIRNNNRAELDFSALPTKIYGGKTCVDWDESVGFKIPFVHPSVNGELEVLSVDSKLIELKFGENTHKFYKENLKNGIISPVIGLDRQRMDYRHKVGDILNGLEVLEKTRGKRNNEKSYKVKCVKCDYEYEKTQNDIERFGCPICTGRKVLEDVNSAYKLRPDLIKYVDEKVLKSHTVNSNKEIVATCPDCGAEKITSMYQLSTNTFSCNVCADSVSSGEKVMIGILENLNIDFIKEVSKRDFQWINGLYRYDFYLPKFKLFLEIDGEFHKRAIYSEYNETKIRDDIKDKLCADNGYKLIRITCNGYNFNQLKDVITLSDLKNYIDFSNVDWNYVLRKMETTKIRTVCEFYMKNKSTNVDIGNIFNLNRITVSRFLDIGSKIYDWCDYDKLKSHFNYFDSLIIPVAQFDKDKNFITCHKNINRLKDILNHNSNITRIRQNPEKLVMGYHWKLMTEEEYLNWEINKNILTF
jgi:very-short-patch-repair endonuclease/predicted  nucleic acid-binding Zn-ribbon protein